MIDLITLYKNNSISEAIVFGGLEPFDSWDDMFSFIQVIRHETLDDIVIYTGYKEEEIEDKIQMLEKIPNIIIKFGRYIPNKQKRYDTVLGLDLASDNQYARKIS